MNFDRTVRKSKGRDPGPVPERWLRCPRKSCALVNNKFLVFKAPLDDRFNEQVDEEFRFPVDFVFNSMKSYKVKVGLWIDLTNTTRFYDKSQVEANDCKYVKMQCKGHGETPSEDQTRAFVQVCETFIRNNPLDVIGVHCTHGFNRSGFMIVSYLVDVLDWGLEAALAEFSKARPPGIYKKDYLEELYRRYDDVNFVPAAPQLPSWCFDYDDSQGDDPDDGERTRKRHRNGGDGGDNTKPAKRRKEFQKQNPTFMDGIEGVEVVKQPLLGQIQSAVQRLCHWDSNGFPGSQPVSMDLENMKYLQVKPYSVSWKADGVRYLMYIKDRDEVYCIDRDNCVFKISNLRFPYKKDLRNQYLKDTLVDGEMVMDKVNGISYPRFLIYDIITILGYDISMDDFMPKRYHTISIEIVEPRHEAMRRGLIQKNLEPFSIRAKDFSNVSNAAKYLEDKFCRTLGHEPDGLIFQPSKGPYVSGRCIEVLKWKPATLNSIDFRLKIKMETGVGIVPKKIGELFVGGMEQAFARISSVKNLHHLENKIIECKYENNKWVYMRERTDKSFPNSYETATGVWNSIRNPVTQDLLLSYIDNHRFVDMMPPPVGLAPRSRKIR